jgi:hypothetical protein
MIIPNKSTIAEEDIEVPYGRKVRESGVPLSITAKYSDLVVIRDLDRQLKQYKCKYEQAKTRLRSVKGTFPSLARFIGNLI